MTEYLQGFMPQLSSKYGHLGDELNGYIHILMLILMVAWGSFFIYCLFRFNSKANPKARYHGITNHYSSYVEGGIVVVEAVLLLAFAIPGYQMVKYDIDSNDDIEVRVIAETFAWNIHYPGPDGKFGDTELKLVSKDNPVGLNRSGFGADDITTVNQLHLPVNKRIKLYISSKDVIHGFALPEMRVKQDAIPGMQVPVYFTPTMTTKEFLSNMKDRDPVRYNSKYGLDDDTYELFVNNKPEVIDEYRGYQIACAQLCGNGHATMRGFMKIYPTEEEYLEAITPIEQEEEEFFDDEEDDFFD